MFSSNYYILLQLHKKQLWVHKREGIEGTTSHRLLVARHSSVVTFSNIHHTDVYFRMHFDPACHI